VNRSGVFLSFLMGPLRKSRGLVLKTAVEKTRAGAVLVGRSSTN
jgi:hypothetical protein